MSAQGESVSLALPLLDVAGTAQECLIHDLGPDRIAVVQKRATLGLVLAALLISAIPAAASHYGDERGASGQLTEREVRLEVRRVLRQRGFDMAVTSGLRQDCQRRTSRRFRCRFSRDLSGGTFKLRGSGSVYVLSSSSGALVRYQLDSTVTLTPPCEGSETVACVSRFYFTHANHQRVSSAG